MCVSRMILILIVLCACLLAGDVEKYTCVAYGNIEVSFVSGKIDTVKEVWRYKNKYVIVFFDGKFEKHSMDSIVFKSVEKNE